MSGIGGVHIGVRHQVRRPMALCPNGAQGDSPGQSEAPPWVWYATKVACPERAEQADKSVPGTRCDKSVPGTRCSETSRCQAPGAGLLARSDASKQAVKSVQRSNQCQAQGTAVPGTRCGARSMLANMRPKSVPGTRSSPGRMLANRRSQAAKSVPGTRRGARSDACKQAVKSVPGTRYGARTVASKQAAKSVPGTRCDAGSDASKQVAPGG